MCQIQLKNEKGERNFFEVLNLIKKFRLDKLNYFFAVG